VITSVRRRRRWSTVEKVRLVEEAMQPGLLASYVARRAGISPSQFFAWKRRMLIHAPRPFRSGDGSKPRGQGHCISVAPQGFSEI
jgi:transposase-like protein